MQIMSELQNLSSTELYIYKYILRHADEIPEMTIGQLARRASTSTASILRLCRKYGFRGFTEFKYQLKKEISSHAVNDSSASSNPVRDIRYFFDETIETDGFRSSIHEAAEMIAEHNMLIFAGLGASNILAEYGVLFFNYLCKMAFRIEDISNMNLEHFPSVLSSDICLVIISTSGESTDIISSVRNYRTSGCRMITITSDPSSSLAKAADAVIASNIPLIREGNDNLTSQVPTCYIIEQLAAEVKEILKKKNANA